MNYILFDEPRLRQSLLPLTFTRPTSALRVGILTIAEKWEKYLNDKISYLTEEYLIPKFPLVPGDSNVLINGAVCPTAALLEEINNLEVGYTLVQNDLILAFKGEANNRYIPFHGELTIIKNPWDIFVENGKEIRKDFELLTKGRVFQKIADPHTIVYNPDNVFIEEGVKIRAAILNAEDGPIYLGKNSEIQEGSVIKGPFALCENSVVIIGGKMRGDTTIGPFSKVSGEISNSVIIGYSNKSHDGFMGNSVIGEWCNFGADTNISNMKNNYGIVDVYSYKEKGFVSTGRQFCGLIMGDHSKTSINTMFNTGTVVGVCANIFGAGFPEKHIPSFAWGGSDGFVTFKLEKAFEVAHKAMERRHIALTEDDKEILKYIFEQDKPAD